MGMNKKEWEETKLINENEKTRQKEKELVRRKEIAERILRISKQDISDKAKIEEFIKVINS